MSTTPSPVSEVRLDGGSGEQPSPALYRPAGTAYGVGHLDDIGPDETGFFGEHGYMVVRQGFTFEEMEAARNGLTDLIMGKNPDFKDIWFEEKAKDILATLDAAQRESAVRKIMHFGKYDPRLDAIAHHPMLLAAVRRLLGGREPELFQEMALIKPPRIGREKPWHQDNAYFDYPLGTPVVGVWIALDEATIENGCMQLLDGYHRKGPIIHFQRRDWQICDKEILGLRSVAAPLKPGGLLLFDGMLPHGTPPNSTASRRRALQFHYAPTGVVPGSVEVRLRNFGSEGRYVSC